MPRFAAAVALLLALPVCRAKEDATSLIQLSAGPDFQADGGEVAADFAKRAYEQQMREAAALKDDDEVKFLGGDRTTPPRTPEEAAADFGGVEGLCKYYDWKPRAPDAKSRRIFYATITGNEGQNDLYEMNFVEASPFVSRIVALDPKMTQQGHPRNASIDVSLPAFSRFGDQLRHVELESPTGGRTLGQLSDEERDALLRPGRQPITRDLLIEQWTRTQLAQGFKDEQGNWEMDDNDLVIVADSDEIPIRYSLAALHYCEVPAFEEVNTNLDKQMAPDAGCRGATLGMMSQVYEYFADCPTKEPYWANPTVTLARCFKNGGMDFEDARTNGNFRGGAMRNVGSRHLHNVGLPVEDIVFKYSHYAEPRAPGLDAGLDAETNQEMMWRGCDENAPEIGPGDWHMWQRPSNDYIRPTNRRGHYMGPEQMRRGLDVPFAILEEKPELAAKLYWKGHAEHENPFVGTGAGVHYFDH